MGGNKPFLIGSKPLLNGKNAPPQPEIAPQAIGPKTGIANVDAGIFAPHKYVILYVAKVARIGHIQEPLPGIVFEHPIGNNRAKVGCAGAEIEVLVAVIVKVSKVASHGG